MNKMPFRMITKPDGGVLDAVLTGMMIAAWLVSLGAALIALGAVLAMAA